MNFNGIHLILTAFLALPLTIEGNQPPNFVVVVCDDLGWGDLSCYGHPLTETPRLDQLARDGVRFTNCYSAAPVCSPSRVGLLTGRSPNRAGVYDWIPPNDGTHPLPDAREQVELGKKETTIASLLQLAGYRTSLAGKWHCNARFNSPAQAQPHDHGFDHWFATQNNASPSHENPNNYIRNGQSVGVQAGYSCQIAVNETLAWIDDSKVRGKHTPFFSFIAFHEPHEPVASPPDLVEKYLNYTKNEDQAQYYANVENMDRAVGHLITGLKKRGLYDNTLIIFTSDNGPETLNRYSSANRSYGLPGHLKGMKLHTHEAGIRVCGIAAWPKVIEPGTIIDTPVSSLDIFPTLCELGGSEIPSKLQLDGTSLTPLLNGDSLERSQPLFWIYYSATNQARASLRDNQWKLLAALVDSEGTPIPKAHNIHDGNIDQLREATLSNFELYDMLNDPSESSNIAGSRPKVVKRLASQLHDIHQDLTTSSAVWKRQNTQAD